MALGEYFLTTNTRTKKHKIVVREKMTSIAYPIKRTSADGK
jgi:hypothetical protein